VSIVLSSDFDRHPLIKTIPEMIINKKRTTRHFFVLFIIISSPLFNVK
jgi:hypothetical protein